MLQDMAGDDEVQSAGRERQMSGVGNHVRRDNRLGDLSVMRLQIGVGDAVDVIDARVGQNRKFAPERADLDSTSAKMPRQQLVLQPAQWRSLAHEKTIQSARTVMQSRGPSTPPRH